MVALFYLPNYLLTNVPVILFNFGPGFFLCNVREIWAMLVFPAPSYYQKINQSKIKTTKKWYGSDDNALGFFLCNNV